MHAMSYELAHLEHALRVQRATRHAPRLAEPRRSRRRRRTRPTIVSGDAIGITPAGHLVAT